MQKRVPRRRQGGQGMLEYGLALGLIAIVVVSVITVVGKRSQSAFCQASTGLSTQACSVYSLGWAGAKTLGTGSTTDTATPAAIGGATSWSQLSSGQEDAPTSVAPHTLALAGGTVYAFGLNNAGQLGDGTTTDQSTPVAVVGLPAGITQVSAGSSSSAALDSTGHVWTWGGNGDGQLGTTGATDALAHPTPTQIPDATLNGVVSIGYGQSRLEVLKSDGTMWGVGNDQYGQSGDGVVTANQPAGGAVPGLVNVASFSFASYHVVAKLKDGSLVSWGRNTYGEVGVSSATSPIKVPTAVANLSGISVQSIVTANTSTAIIDSQGRLWTWGEAGGGELGNGTSSPNLTAPAMTTVTGLVSIAAGAYHFLALNNQAQVLGWGSSGQGALGFYGGTSTPVLVGGFPSTSKVVGLAAGYRVSYALVD